jgi:hypothetical protein
VQTPHCTRARAYTAIYGVYLQFSVFTFVCYDLQDVFLCVHAAKLGPCTRVLLLLLRRTSQTRPHTSTLQFRIPVVRPHQPAAAFSSASLPKQLHHEIREYSRHGAYRRRSLEGKRPALSLWQSAACAITAAAMLAAWLLLLLLLSCQPVTAFVRTHSFSTRACMTTTRASAPVSATEAAVVPNFGDTAGASLVIEEGLLCQGEHVCTTPYKSSQQE